jgi:DNA polymerase-3 subunit delta
LNYGEFEKSLSHPSPLYLLVTDQDYLKQKVLRLCERQVEESLRAFNWAIFDLAKEKGIDSREKTLGLINTARTLPWMAERRWIYVRNGQDGGEELKQYLGEPEPRTVMVLEVPRKVSGWPAMATVEMGVDIDFAAWLQRKARLEGYSIEPAAAEMLVELVGDDLARLESELEKQILWQLDSRMITLDSVLKLAVEARERDIFELIGAMANGRVETALRVLDRLFVAGASPQQILALLYWNFRRLLVAKEMLEREEPYHRIVRSLKIWSYKDRRDLVRKYEYKFLSQVLLKLRETDRLCKTTQTEAKIHLERVVIDTCGKGSV